MNTTSETMQHPPARETSLKWIAGGSMVEAIGALATIALAIVGLAGIFPATLAAIATIVLGAALVIEAGSFGAGAMASWRVGEFAATQNGTGSTGFLGGVAGIVLGILALLGVAPLTLLSVAVLVYGGTFLVGSLSPQMGASHLHSGEGHGSQFMVGTAGLVLGILAVVGGNQLVLVLVGLLCLGAGALFSGSLTGARSMAAVSRS